MAGGTCYTFGVPVIFHGGVVENILLCFVNLFPVKWRVT